MNRPPIAALLLLSTVHAAHADPQKWPYLFDPSVAADPAGTATYMHDGEAALPLLPVDQLTVLQTGDVTRVGSPLG